ncbi:glycosyltransferase family 2 protein [Halopelagius fulvigenes]|uniref:Glycosyltransferase family 2 protein n=1 Tax=Halopelagius fulvigenes TaxID=1198324 RepID=A0ABD5U259_9EURY
MEERNPLVSFVLATYNRPTDLAEAIESILAQQYEPFEVVVVSSSTDETSELFADGGRFDGKDVYYHEFDERMGVPKARNIGFELASGDIFVTIDDDAVLGDPDATSRLVSLFGEHEDVGVVAFRSRSYETGGPILMEIPDPPDIRMSSNEQYRASSFCGVGNAIRSELLDDVGAYPPDFVYGFEEHDLSLRLLDAGWDILYAPSVEVYHKQTPKARLPSAETRERQIANRIRLAVRNLPWRYVVFTTLVWSVYAVVTAQFRLAPLRRILGSLYDERDALLAERDVIDRRTIELLKSRGTMLYAWWYGPDPRRVLANPDRLLW